MKMHCIKRTHIAKNLKTFHFPKTVSAVNNPNQVGAVNWKNIISDAEKIVGYPTSFWKSRWLMYDKVTDFTIHLRKLTDADHPLLETAKKQLYENGTPLWGLIVLLISKAAGQNREFTAAEKDLTSGVLYSQRDLSEIIEMIRNSQMLHKSVLNLYPSMEHFEDNHFANKIALLSGDYFLSITFQELARIKNFELNILISSALRDLSENEFIGRRDKQNRSLPVKPRPSSEKIEVVDEFDTEPLKVESILGNARAEWTLRNILGGASLLAKSCQGSLLLAEHSKEFQRVAYFFGKHIALTIQANKEIEAMKLTDDCINLVSAPVLFHLQCNPDFYAEIENLVENEATNWAKVRDYIAAGPGMEKAKELREENYRRAMQALKLFAVSDSRVALERILNESRSQ